MIVERPATGPKPFDLFDFITLCVLWIERCRLLDEIDASAARYFERIGQWEVKS